MKNSLLGIVLAAIVLFIWGFISWAILPWHNMAAHKFADEAQVTQFLGGQVKEGGIYYLPFSEEDYKEDVLTAFINIQPEGPALGMGEMMGMAILGQILSATLAMLLLMQTALLNYWKKVQFVTLTGFTVGFISHFPYWNWFSFPTTYVVVIILDMTIAYFLAGMVLAKFTDKETNASTS